MEVERMVAMDVCSRARRNKTNEDQHAGNNAVPLDGLKSHIHFSLFQGSMPPDQNLTQDYQV